ncbi:MAG: ABC transporter ATP-binding protein [Gemmatimonadaceae bacterium]|nr:ABC transporter ATP-binding protein [Gemmatimonadaceae bacterium]
MNAPSLLTIENLCVDFPTTHGTVRAVDGCSFTIAPGERVGIVGESGSGKSQTMVSIFGLQPMLARTMSGQATFNARSGSVDLLHRDHAARDALLGREVAMMFQDPSRVLIPYWTIAQHMDHIVHRHGHEGSASPVELLASLGFPNPEHLLRAPPQQLSGGEAQRALLAISMLMRPRLLIADEPTTGLDLINQAHVLDVLRQQQAAHQFALILISHDLAVIDAMVDRVIVMQAGRIVEQATAEHLRRAPDEALHPYTKSLRDSHRRRTRGTACPSRVAPVTTSASLGAPAPMLLEVRGLTKVYPPRRRLFSRAGAPRRTVDDVSFALRRGEVLGIVGESGSGKTTVARMLLRLVEATAGEVRLDGVDILPLRAPDLRRDVRPRIRMVFQDPDAVFNPACTVGHTLRQAITHHATPDAQSSSAGALNEAVASLLHAVDLPPSFAEKYPDQLSGGQKRRIGISRVLATQPSVVVADEPLSGLDVVLQERVLTLLLREQQRRGFGLILVSHDLDRVYDVCDQVIVMQRGRVVERVTADRSGDGQPFHFTHPYSCALEAARRSLLAG